MIFLSTFPFLDNAHVLMKILCILTYYLKKEHNYVAGVSDLG